MADALQDMLQKLAVFHLLHFCISCSVCSPVYTFGYGRSRLLNSLLTLPRLQDQIILSVVNLFGWENSHWRIPLFGLTRVLRQRLY